MTQPGLRHRGFTLLEMLAAATMVAVLAAALFAALHMAFRARDSAIASVQTVRKMDLTLERIRQDLQSAAIPNGVLAGLFVSSDNPDLSGTEDYALSFYASPPDEEPSPGVGDIRKIEYACVLSGSGGEFTLVRRVTVNLLATVAAEPTEEVLCRGVRNFALTYFDGLDWQDAWDSSAQDNVLPKAVEVTIELSDSGSGGGRISRVILLPCGQGSSGTVSSGVSP